MQIVRGKLLLFSSLYFLNLFVCFFLRRIHSGKQGLFASRKTRTGNSVFVFEEPGQQKKDYEHHLKIL